MKQYSFRACLHHRQVLGDEGEEEFYKTHRDCSSEKVTSVEAKQWLEKVDGEKEVDRAVKSLEKEVEKLNDSPLSVSSCSSTSSKVTESSRVAGKITNKRLLTDLDMSSTDEEISPVKHSSPKKARIEGIKTQTVLWNRDVGLARVSQQHSLDLMTDKVKRMDATNKRLLQENEEMRIKVGSVQVLRKELEESRAREKELLDERRVNRDRIERAEKLEREMKEREVELDRLRREVKEIEGMRREFQGLREDRKKLEVMREKGRKRRYEVHIPFHNHQVCDTPLVNEIDLNATQECYSLPEQNIQCLHLEIASAGEIEEFYVKKYRLKVPSKFLTFSHYVFLNNLSLISECLK